MMLEITCVPNFQLLQISFSDDFYSSQFMKKQNDSVEFNCIQSYWQFFFTNTGDKHTAELSAERSAGKVSVYLFNPKNFLQADLLSGNLVPRFHHFLHL